MQATYTTTHTTDTTRKQPVTANTLYPLRLVVAQYHYNMPYNQYSPAYNGYTYVLECGHTTITQDLYPRRNITTPAAFARCCICPRRFTPTTPYPHYTSAVWQLRNNTHPALLPPAPATTADDHANLPITHVIDRVPNITYAYRVVSFHYNPTTAQYLPAFETQFRTRKAATQYARTLGGYCVGASLP